MHARDRSDRLARWVVGGEMGAVWWEEGEGLWWWEGGREGIREGIREGRKGAEVGGRGWREGGGSVTAVGSLEMGDGTWEMR